MLKLIDRARARFPATESFKITDSLLEEIKTDLRSAKSNPVRIATRLGVPIALVRFVSNETPSGTSNFTVLSEDGWGRHELRDFIISRKQAGAEWPKEDELVLETHKEAYDDGLVELAQGRDGNFIIQYSFPRHKPVRRSYRYFQNEEEQ